MLGRWYLSLYFKYLEMSVYVCLNVLMCSGVILYSLKATHRNAMKLNKTQGENSKYAFINYVLII